MKKALWIGHDTTGEQLSAALPEGWSLSCCPTLNAAVQYLALGEGVSAILVELNDELKTPGCIPALRQRCSTLLAIISDANERDLCFRLGVPDYLLKPLNPVEILVRFPVDPALPIRPAAQLPSARLEKMAAIGRLTSHICHEISNPMQAIRGAASLALEEPDIAETLRMYLNLCQQEAGRVVTLVERMRRLYRSDSRRPAPVDLAAAWSDAIGAAWEELERSRVLVTNQIGPDSPTVMGDPDQIFLAFLGILLAASDHLHLQGGGSLLLNRGMQEGFTCFELSIEPLALESTGSIAPQRGSALSFQSPAGLQLTLSESILSAHQGRIEVEHAGGSLAMHIFLPGSPAS